MIDWTKVQTNLNSRGFDCGTVDGIVGRNTYKALFKFMGPTALPEILASLGNSANIHFPVYGMDKSVDRLADFLAQTANESGSYSVFEENLNYSAKRLMQVWPGRFPNLLEAQAFAMNPKALANKTYGGRMGNVNPDDGWNYRGRGLLQLTGRSNYELADRTLGLGLDTHPEIASVPAISLLIACDFYRRGKVLEALDRKDFTLARKITNGGAIGLEHVNQLRSKAMQVLG